MDLRKISVADTAFLHLRDANDMPIFAQKTVQIDGADVEVDDESKPVGITMYSPGSKEAARANAAKNSKLMERMRAKGKMNISAEESGEDAATFLAAVTKEFHHIERDQLQGDALFKAVFRDSSHGFVAEQANAFHVQWANFSKGSPKT